jgi:uncharacterized delta-60 repeat protein
LLVQGDGRLVAAGSALSGGQSVVAVARYLTTGQLDPSFATFGTGVALTTLGTGAAAFAAALQADGAIVAAGQAVVNGQNVVALVRYTSAGIADPTFGTGGQVLTAINSGSASANAVAIQADGSIVAAGYGTNGAQTGFAVLRYSATGVPDAIINGNGQSLFNTGAMPASAVVLGSDGLAYLTGGGVGGFVTARVNLGSLTISLPPPPVVVTYDGSPHPVTATTNAVVSTAITYQPFSDDPLNGGVPVSGQPSTTVAPTAVGWYQVVATITGTNASATTTLHIQTNNANVEESSDGSPYINTSCGLGSGLGVLGFLAACWGLRLLLTGIAGRRSHERN